MNRLALALALLAPLRLAAAERSLSECAGLADRLDSRSAAGELAEALRLAERCLAAASAAGDRAAVAGSRVALAETRALAGDWSGSLAAAGRAAEGSARIGDARLGARAENASGDALFNLWRLEEAVAAFERALVLARRAGDAGVEAATLKNLGITQALLGRRDLALLRLEEAIELAPGWESEALGVSILGNLGTIYYRLGAPRSALAAYEEALAVARRRGRTDEISDVLGRMAYFELWMGRAERSRDLFAAALEAARAAGPTAELPLLEGAAAAFEATGDDAAALAELERLAAFFASRPQPAALCAALESLARFEETRRPERAAALYRRAGELADRAGPACRWPALAGAGRLAGRAGRRDEAIELASGAVVAVEERWRRLVSEQQRRELLGRADATYRELAERLVERGLERESDDDLARAFAVVERSRSALLTQSIAEARRALPAGVPEEQRRAIRGLERELLALRREIEASPEGDPGLARRLERLARRETELDEHLRNVRRAPARGALPHSVTAEEARRLLPEGSALVSFLVGDESSFAFLLTADALRVVRLPARRAILSEQVEGFVDLLRDDGGSGWVEAGHRLYRDLVAPWASHLETGLETLIVVPDRELASLPFEALPIDGAGGRLLVDRLAVAYAPSATALAELERAPAADGREIWIFADPRSAGGAAPPGRRRMRALYEEDGHDLAAIPFGRVEARRVAAHAGPAARLLAGRDATEARLKSLAAGRFALLHFATHGLLSPADPARSALLLAADPDGGEDGFLQAREIAELRLGADLVVLAACRTARGQASAGESVRSLAEAFFVAGARAVVGTLWEVEDDDSLRLMTSFYEELAAGRGKADALRAAKLAARARRAPPAEWAGFVLLGEPARGVALGSRERPSPAARWALLGLAALGLALLARRHSRFRRPARSARSGRPAAL